MNNTSLLTCDTIRTSLIRCKDCENWDEDYSAGRVSLNTYCALCQEWSDFEDGHMVYTKPDEFCSRGEWRDSINITPAFGGDCLDGSALLPNTWKSLSVLGENETIPV
jgi:hypothetical protein